MHPVLYASFSVSCLDHNNSPFFEGEVEPCINGRVLACGAYFGEASDRLVDRLLSEQLEDGGWNCDAPQSKRSSFNSTICVLEGLLEYEKAKGGRSTVRDARLRGQEYLLERRVSPANVVEHAVEDDADAAPMGSLDQRFEVRLVSEPPVDSVMIDGTWVYRHKEFTTMDAEQIVAQGTSELHHLLGRVKGG